MSEIPKFNQDMFVDLGDGVREQNYEWNENFFLLSFINFLNEHTIRRFGIKFFICQFFCGILGRFRKLWYT